MSVIDDIQRLSSSQLELEKWLTACSCSRTLAQYSTDVYAGGLYCRVRNGTGCDPAAMAVRPNLRIDTSYLIISMLIYQLGSIRHHYPRLFVNSVHWISILVQ